MRAEAGALSAGRSPNEPWGKEAVCFGAGLGGKGSSSCPSVPSRAFPPSVSPCTCHPLVSLLSGFSAGRSPDVVLCQGKKDGLGGEISPSCSSLPAPRF